jgi:hypothetical protein
LGRGAKKQEVSDEWRSGCAEEKLEYALVKVGRLIYKALVYFNEGYGC